MTNDNGETPLHFAVKGGSYDAVVALIEKFADLQVSGFFYLW